MDKITIKGYKSFKDITIDLKQLNLLIGSNGAGKSNFLSVFEMLGRCFNQSLTNYVASKGGVDKFLFQGRKETEHIEVKVVQDANSYTLKLQEADGKFLLRKFT